MKLFTLFEKCGLGRILLLLSLAGPAMASAPAITSATSLDVYYDVENPADLEFAYRIVASGAAVTFDANGLPPYATLDRATGWINGSRNAPGLYNVAVRASNADGTDGATVRVAIHPATIGVRSSAGIFRTGQTFSVTLNYNTPVIVTGAPRLTLAIGSAGTQAFKDAVYASGSGTSELVFEYVVAAGDDDPDGVQVLPAAPTGGSICDARGLVASPSLPVRHFISGITIVAAPALGAGPAVSAVAAPVTPAGQLTNVSVRMRVAAGDASRSLIAGFVINGSESKRVLLRAIGPGLVAFGVQDALADPRLQLYSSTGALLAENDDWSGSETASVAAATGAFALAAGARDSALVVTLPPGAYTLIVSSNDGEGVALAELYDADPGVGTSTISNLSTRGQSEGDASPLIAGFTVQGTVARRVLIRGIGPGLALFGVGAALADPILKIFHDGRLIGENDNWATAAAENTSAAAASGAFALAADSKDAAIVLTLDSGSYTAVVTGTTDTGGAGLVEVYDLPAKS